MKTILLLALLAFPQDPDVTEKIAKLSLQLGSDSIEERETATTKLIKLGRPARDAMKKLLESSDAEIRARANLTIQEIQATLRAKALKLEIATERKSYKPGEKIRIVANIKNIEDFPLITLRSFSHAGITASIHFTTQREDATLAFDHDCLPGWECRECSIQSRLPQRHIITEDCFISLRPGDAIPLYTATLGKRISPWPLEPGKYKVKAMYHFAPCLPLGETQFEGKSKPLYSDCWTGSLDAECEFEVVEK